MSENLYLKYRPTSLEEVYGNRNIIPILKSMVKNDKVPHTMLFHGPSGCGKTTLARIMASELGCASVSLSEYDSAQFRGIDTVRDIRRECTYAPLKGDIRVYILDEVHKMTNDAQNGLLKILEDTPSHVYFMLCTTDPNKLIAAIKTRCSQMQVNPLSDEEMKELLRYVVKEEEEKLSKEVYEQIIKDSFGSPRQALQILNQVLQVDEKERLEVAKQTAEKESQAIELARALFAKKKWVEVAAILRQLKDQDVEGTRRVVAGYATTILLSKNEPLAGLILEYFVGNFYDTGFPQLVHACYSVSVGANS